MKRNTTTTIGALRQGDRFYFLSDTKKEVHQVISFSKLKTNYNQIINDKKAFTFDRDALNTKPVMFLRHTLLQQDDECYLQDLAPGDTFFVGKSKMELVVKHPLEVKMKRLSDGQFLFSHPLSNVIVDNILRHN